MTEKNIYLRQRLRGMAVGATTETVATIAERRIYAVIITRLKKRIGLNFITNYKDGILTIKRIK